MTVGFPYNWRRVKASIVNVPLPMTVKVVRGYELVVQRLFALL